jgi:hypothetical protein
MTGKTSVRDQGIKIEDHIGFLRESALVNEIDGNPALTTKGEQLLQGLQGLPSRSPKGTNSPEDSDLTDGRV